MTARRSKGTGRAKAARRLLTHPRRLAAYLAAVVTATLFHEPAWLAAALALALLLSGGGWTTLLRRAVLAVLPVNLLISAGYLLAALFSGEPRFDYLLLLNVRVVLIAVLTAWMVRDVDLDSALARWPAARRWLAVVRVQVMLFRRLFSDYREAFASRTTEPPSLSRRYRLSASQGLAALDKAVHNSEELVQGMRSRGAFDDC